MGHAKFMGYTGPVQMRYKAWTLSTHINNREGTFFWKTYTGQVLFPFIFMHFLQQNLFVLITKTNLSQAAKITLIKKCLINF